MTVPTKGKQKKKKFLLNFSSPGKVILSLGGIQVVPWDRGRQESHPSTLLPPEYGSEENS